MATENPERVTRRQLHGLLASWFDPLFPKKLHDQGAKPWTLGGFDVADGVLAVDIGLLIDRLAEPMHDALAAEVSHLGGHAALVLPTPQGNWADCLVRLSWETMLQATPVTGWKIRFETLTTFRQGKLYDVFPTPQRVLAHLRAGWTAFAPDPLTQWVTTPLRDAPMATTDAKLRTVRETHYSGQIAGVEGSVHQQLAKRDDALEAAAAAWLQLVPVAGIGFGTPHGFGVSRVLATQPSHD